MDPAQDPATLTDAELDKELGIEPPKEEPKSEPKTEPEKTEPAEPEAQTEEPPTEAAPEVETPEEKPPSRRAEFRYQQLLAKLKEQSQVQAPPKREDALNYAEELNADPETIKRLEVDRQAAEAAQYRAGADQAKSIQFHTRLEIDAPRVEAKFPFMDPSSSEFNSAAALAMNSKYLQFVGFNGETDTVVSPNIRYADFVEAEMEFANEIATHKIAETKKSIARQAASTGLRPDGSSPKRLNLNQSPQSMTDEELDAVIAQAIPKR